MTPKNIILTLAFTLTLFSCQNSNSSTKEENTTQETATIDENLKDKIEETCVYKGEHMACTMQWDPVCTVYKDGTEKTSGNSCTACLSKDALGFRKGECGAEKKPVEK